MLIRRARRTGPYTPLWVASTGDVELEQFHTSVNWSLAAWITANRGIYMPLRLPFDGYLTAMTTNCNSTTGTNDLGVYTAAGNKIVTRGATANVNGNSTWTLTNGIWLRAGTLYTLAMSCSSVTPQFQRIAPTAGYMRAVGYGQELSVATLPASITPVANTTAYIPLIVFTFGNDQLCRV